MAAGRALKNFLDACHHGPKELPGWSDLIMRSVDPLVENVGVGLAVHVPASTTTGLGGATGGMEVIGQILPFESQDTDAVRAAYAPFRVSPITRVVGVSDLAAAPALRPLAPLFRDLWGVFVDGGRVKVVVVVPEWRHESRRPSLRGLQRIQRHLAGAALRRSNPAWENQAALLIGSGGSLVPPSNALTFDQIESITRAFNRDDRLKDEPDEEVERLWDELWAGGWSVASIIEDDGRRSLALRRRHPEQPRLTPTETRVLSRAAAGLSLKGIADDLGVTISTASSHLQRALSKLGLTDRTELTRILAPVANAKA